MPSPRDTNPPYSADIAASRPIKLPLGQLVTLCIALVTCTATCVVYAMNLERAVRDLQVDVQSLKAETVMRTPFYAWVGQFRYDVIAGAKVFPPEPRPFFSTRPVRYEDAP